jgi:hypothetical protein
MPPSGFGKPVIRAAVRFGGRDLDDVFRVRLKTVTVIARLETGLCLAYRHEQFRGPTGFLENIVNPELA